MEDGPERLSLQSERGCVGDQPQQWDRAGSFKVILNRSTCESAAADPARRGTQPRSGGGGRRRRNRGQAVPAPGETAVDWSRWLVALPGVGHGGNQSKSNQIKPLFFMKNVAHAEGGTGLRPPAARANRVREYSNGQVYSTFLQVADLRSGGRQAKLWESRFVGPCWAWLDP